MTTATFNGGKVQVYDDNLTDISENLFWFREVSDQHAATQTALLKDILTVLRQIHEDLQQNNQPTTPVHFVHSLDKHSGQQIVPVVIDGQTYTSPKLMQVIKWLEVNPTKRNMTVREIADETGVSKSWVAIAKKYRPNE